MSGVRISAATLARRSRIASIIGILTPAVDGAGSCVLVTRPGEPFAALLGRPAVGRGCSHHLLCESCSVCDLDSRVPLVPGPHTRARADQPWEGGCARAVRGGTDGGSAEGAPTLAAAGTIRQPAVTGGHIRSCDHGGVPADRKKVLLAAPRGYCAGVERAVEAVERALERHGAPVYVRKQIVHNIHVVRDLEAKGAIFVDEIDQVPVGAVTVLSAHGSPPSVYDEARRRRLELIDATCPLVTKVHVEARRFAGEGRTIVLIGHAGHEEGEGTSGQAPASTVLVQ